MKAYLIAVGTRTPEWITAGFEDYQRRLPSQFTLELIEIPLIKRTKQQNIKSILLQEGERMLATVPENTEIIALDVKGKTLNTEQFSEALSHFHQDSRNISFLIGGPDGLAPECLKRAHRTWSLSALTLPHALVRLVIAEQFYRAWSIISNHPYHRS